MVMGMVQIFLIYEQASLGSVCRGAPELVYHRVRLQDDVVGNMLFHIHKKRLPVLEAFVRDRRIELLFEE